MPTATWPMPDQESSHMRSAQRSRSYEGKEHRANPTAARRSWPRWSSMGLLDHLVRSKQDCLRDRHAEGLSRLELDDQLNLGRLLGGEIRGLGSLQDLIHEGGRLSVRLTKAWRIRHQAASFHIVTLPVHRGQTVRGRKVREPRSLNIEHRVPRDEDRV